MLGVNATDGATLSTRAILLAKLGRQTEALEASGRAVAAAPGDALVLYERAVVHAILGDEPAALEQLREALASGYPAPDVLQDDEWQTFEGRPWFRKLVPPGNGR